MTFHPQARLLQRFVQTFDLGQAVMWQADAATIVQDQADAEAQIKAPV